MYSNNVYKIIKTITCLTRTINQASIIDNETLFNTNIFNTNC